jgi:hypothetical protein
MKLLVFPGEKGLWSVAEEALLSRGGFGEGEFSVLGKGIVCGGSA